MDLFTVKSTQEQYLYAIIKVNKSMKSEFERLKDELFGKNINETIEKITIDDELDPVDTIGQEFNFEQDVLTQIHIQKTSGQTWESHIFEHLHIKRNQSNKFERICKSKGDGTIFFDCLNNTYGKSMVWNRNFFYSTCDYHADYTETHNCFMYDYESRVSKYKGIAHFFTIIRDPIKRYVSEYKFINKNIEKYGRISLKFYFILSMNCSFN